MKRLIVLLSIILFISCNSDDDVPQTEIVAGTYKLTSIVPSEPIDTNYDGNFITTDIIDLMYCEDFELELSGNSEFSINMLNQSVQARREQFWTGSSSFYFSTFVYCTSIYNHSGIFAVSGNNITGTIDSVNGQIREETIQVNFQINEDIITFEYIGAFITEASTDPYDFRDVEFLATFVKE